MGRLSTVLLIAGLILAVFSSMGCTGRVDPETGRVRVLFLGEVARTNELFLGWIAGEPQFALTRVPCDIEWIPIKAAKKFARIYLPRSETTLLDDYDVAVFEDFTPVVLPVSVLDWFQAAVSKGLGLGLIEFANWGGTNEIQKWMSLHFYDLFPADVIMNDFPATQGRTFYEVMNKDGPLELPGIESYPMNRGHHGDLAPRVGSTVEGVWRGRGTPCMVTSSYGRGHTLQLDHGWDNIPDDTRIHYRYLVDYIFNQIFYLAGIPYPKDLDLVHSLRTLFINYEDRRRATIAVAEFVERFGANPSKALEHLESLKARRDEASTDYLKGNYEEARDLMSSVLTELPSVDHELMKAKERALFWIYLIEWTSVFAVSLITSFVVWTLMVKRRLYREVETTRSI